jgi:multidrug efflux pump
MKRNLQLKGQFHTAQDIASIVVRSPQGGYPVYLKDIATIKDTIKDRESYARLDGKNVVTLNIIKRAGENLIETSDTVRGTVQRNAGQLTARSEQLSSPVTKAPRPAIPSTTWSTPSLSALF